MDGNENRIREETGAMSDKNSASPVQLHDIAAAFSLLTRLPVPVDHTRAGERAAAAVWAWPLVGAMVGLLGGVFGAAALWLGAPAGIAAAVVIAVMMLATGGLHEDGIADCADGLGAGSDRARRLEIMQDSHIGAFGVAALAVVLIARWSGSEGLLDGGSLLGFAAAGTASRLPMVLALHLMPTARDTGMSASVGRPDRKPVSIAVGLSLIICILTFGLTGVWVLVVAILTALPLFLLAQRLIGGQTGDILGGSQQLAEIAALAAVAAAVT